MGGALIQRLCFEPREQGDQRRHRVFGAVRIGRMALHAFGREPAGHRPASADLHHLAHHIGAGGFAHKAMGHPFALGSHPVEKGDGAIGGHVFLVAGDGKDHRAIGRGLAHEINGGGGECGDAGFHVGRSPPIHPAVNHLGAKGIAGPGGEIADRHHIGMAVEAKALVGPFGPPARVKIGDAAPVHPRAGKACAFQKVLQEDQRAALNRGDRGAADQICRQGGGVNGRMAGHGLSFWRAGFGIAQPPGQRQPCLPPVADTQPMRDKSTEDSDWDDRADGSG